MLGNGAPSYFGRSGAPAPDGRQFDQRTLEAVDRVAANVTSYREFVAALANAKTGDLITITEKINVPETIKMTKEGITITCIGRGAIYPTKKGITLFSFVDIGGGILDRIVLRQNKKGEQFEIFVDFTQALPSDTKPVAIENFKNIVIRDCIITSNIFLFARSSTGLKAVNVNNPEIDDQSVWTWESIRSLVHGNRHRSSDDAIEFDNVNNPGQYRKEGCIFVTGRVGVFSFVNNSSEGYLILQGSGNNVTANNIYGSILTGAATSSTLLQPTSQRNLFVGNLTGWQVNLNGEPNNVAASNQVII